MLNSKSVNVVYFTGTGGTRYIADCIKEAFNRRNILVCKKELDLRDQTAVNDDADMLVLLFPVYAMNAPLPIHKWIESIQKVNGKPAVVISVSGGGEITPNTACRVGTVKELEGKGFKVIYEKMLVMPSNWVVDVKDEIAIKLLRAAPIKVEKIVQDIMSGVENRISPKIFDRFISTLSTVEKKATKYFGKKIKVNDNCSSCGWCANNCPQCNISINSGKPIFGDKCVICLRCIYGCPKKALEPGLMKFILIKEGYDLSSIQKKMQDVSEINIDDYLEKGWVWDGVRKYLKEG